MNPVQNNTFSLQSYALITGASRGIGRAMAHECAHRGIHLVLVALPGEGLDKVSNTIKHLYPVQIYTYETDLTCPRAPKQLYDWCVTQRLTINILINNAGIGQQGCFENLSITSKLSLMQLNMQVPVALVHLFLPMLKMYRASYILNVGSIAAFSPIPYKTLYSASKSFVLALSQALRYELKDTTVAVSCLCPGPTLTSEQVQRNTRSLGWRGTLLEMRAHQVATHAIRGMLQGKEIIVPGWKHKCLELFSRYMPDQWITPAAGRIFSASRKPTDLIPTHTLG